MPPSRAQLSRAAWIELGASVLPFLETSARFREVCLASGRMLRCSIVMLCVVAPRGHHTQDMGRECKRIVDLVRRDIHKPGHSPSEILAGAAIHVWVA